MRFRPRAPKARPPASNGPSILTGTDMSSPAQARDIQESSLPSLRPMLWLVATAAFMQMLDTTIVNTALPSMATGLGESPLRMQAVVASYALAVAMMIPASGWLADKFGTRRVFIAAVVLFSVGSLACALSRE